jgi:hypothetical protein
MEEIKIVYGNYCRNNQDSLNKIVELLKDQEFKELLMNCQLNLKYKTDAWDLSSLIIKPVQRVLKYPLLLRVFDI